MKLSGFNPQQNKISFGNYKVQIAEGALVELMGQLKGSFIEKADAIYDIVEFKNGVNIKHKNDGIIVLSNFYVDNKLIKGTPMFSFDALIDGKIKTKKVGGVNHAAITYPDQILNIFKAGVKMIGVNLSEI